MRDSWLEVVDSLLRPARPHLERCLAEREAHLAARRVVTDERTHALRACEAKIEGARAAVFAAKDGVVSARMTELEREWRQIARVDSDAGLMDLWARIAPPTWIDRKLWRGSAPSARLDAAIALAADPSGVEAAEAAVASLRAVCAESGVSIGPKIRWRLFEQDAECTTALLAPAIAGAAPGRLERAQRLEEDVRTRAGARFSDRPALVYDLGRAAFVDALAPTLNPTTSLRALWKTGYSLSAADVTGVVLEIPAL